MALAARLFPLSLVLFMGYNIKASVLVMHSNTNDLYQGYYTSRELLFTQVLTRPYFQV
jgi:hypothetical protein